MAISVKFAQNYLNKENLQKIREMKAKEVKVFLKEDGTIIFLKKQEREGVQALDLLEMCDLL